MRTMFVSVMMLFLVCDSCSAQGLFGQRTLGGSLGKRTRTSPQEGDAARRFLRDERSATDFVGSAPSGGGAAGFVGGNSAVTSVTSSVAGLTEERRPPVNRPRIVRPAGLYPERLQIDDGASGKTGAVSLQRSVSAATMAVIQARSLSIEVSSADRSATLRGAVPSEHDRRMTELLVMLEPGIQNVENQLTVDPTLPPLPRSRRPSNSDSTSK